MRVAKRVALGHWMLVLLIVFILAVEVFAFRRLQEVNLRNSGENLQVALIAVDLVRDGDVVEEAARRSVALADQASKDDLKESQQRFEDALREIRAFRSSEREQSEAERLERFWREYLEGSAKMPAVKAGAAGLPEDVSDALSRVRTQSVTVYQALLQEIRNSALESRKYSERTELIVWWTGCAGLTLGIVIALLIIRSIAGPLRSLAEGTRAIAEGKSYYRLDTSRSDELSQIARDFNAIVESRGEGKGPGDTGTKKVEL